MINAKIKKKVEKVTGNKKRGDKLNAVNKLLETIVEGHDENLYRTSMQGSDAGFNLNCRDQEEEVIFR